MRLFRALRADRRGYVAVEYTAIAAASAFFITKGVHEVGVQLGPVFRTLALYLPL